MPALWQEVGSVLRRVNVCHRSAEIRPARGHQIAGYPFRQRGKAGQGAVDGASQGFRGQTTGQRIGRLHFRHLVAVFRPHHMVGMRHLWLALADFNAAADDPPFAGREHAADEIIARMKDDLQPAAFILGDDAPGAAGARGRPVMLDHQHLDSDNAAVNHLVQPGRARLSINPTGRWRSRSMTCAPIRFSMIPANQGPARQHCRGGKQAKNLGGTFRMHGSRCSGPGAFRLPESRRHDKIMAAGPCAHRATSCLRRRQILCFGRHRAAYCAARGGRGGCESSGKIWIWMKTATQGCAVWSISQAIRG